MQWNPLYDSNDFRLLLGVGVDLRLRLKRSLPLAGLKSGTERSVGQRSTHLSVGALCDTKYGMCVMGRLA